MQNCDYSNYEKNYNALISPLLFYHENWVRMKSSSLFQNYTEYLLIFLQASE